MMPEHQAFDVFSGRKELSNSTTLSTSSKVWTGEIGRESSWFARSSVRGRWMWFISG